MGIALATGVGFVVGVARLSSNWLVAKIAGAYIELFRNIPLLVQLFFWYFGVFLLLPRVAESIRWPGSIYLNNRGIFFPWAETSSSFAPWLIVVAGGIILAVAARVYLVRFQGRTGRSAYPNFVGFAVLISVAAIGWMAMGQSPLSPVAPELGEFNFHGGAHLSPEFMALLVGLVVYTGAFIAEIVRAGIQSVPLGQVEAAKALGMGEMETIKLVVLPQALPVIIPPLISQYLNLTKNSSLAAAIAYPDLFSVGKIMINQAGRAVPVFLLIMAAYLSMSLIYALIGNLYNRHIRFSRT